MHQTSLLIGQHSVEASGGRTFDRTDPLTGEVATRAAAASIEDARAAVDAAQAAFSEWSALGPQARRAVLNRAADAIEARKAEFIDAGVAETGATSAWIGFNVGLAAGMLREAASMVTRIVGETIPTGVPGNLAMSVRKPRGVCVGIAPWNAPVILGVRAIAMPLACGNTVVLKASESCPRTHRLIGDAMVDAGVPQGVVNVVTNDPAQAGEVVEALVSHPSVRHVNFTGSTSVGRQIARLAAEQLTPVLLELGGKAPMVVLAGADIDAAVAAAAFGGFMNQGQICMSTDRIIVDESVADEFVRKFAAKIATLSVGDGRGPHHLGALIHEGAARRIEGLLEDARGKGATVIGGGRNGTLMQPAIVDGVTSDMRIYREEIFGPAVGVWRVTGDDAAIAAANDTEYGLSAAVFCQDLSRALSAADRIESGICHVNGPTVHDEGQMPFGGVKDSGYGRFGGVAAIEEFTHLRWITVQTGTRHYPF
ncbi:MAG: aldehyde dehydrogenase [Myxococcales bacterium]|nr:aldehyde dehydrogenase [Myxococcales bacterium]